MADFQFVKYFKHLLFDHKRLIIPGLGKFYLDRVSASFTPDKQVIHPPSYQLRFEKDLIQQNLDSFIALKNYYPNVQEQDFKIYSRQVVDQLLSRGYVAIDDLGKLRMDNGEISFDKNFQTQGALTSALPPISIQNLRTFIPKNAYLIMDRIQPPHKFWIIWLPLIVAALLLLGLLGIFKRMDTFAQDPNKQKPPIVVVDTVDNVDTIGSNSEENSPDSSGEIIKINDSLKAIITDGTVNADGTYNKKCIIVTGAYRTAKYRDLMIENLRTRGLKIFLDTTPSGLTRVGFEFECAETDLNKYLDSIRNVVQEDAWYYMPDFSKKQG